MRKLLPLSLVLGGAVALNVGCASGPMPAPAEGMQSAIDNAERLNLRVLTSREVRRLIVGHTVRPEPRVRAFRMPQLQESFAADGRYTASAPGITLSGNYRFRSNSVCLSSANYPEYCYVFFQGAAGQYFRSMIFPSMGPERVNIG